MTVRGWKSIGSLWFEPEGKTSGLITLTAESGSYQSNGSESSLFVNHVLSSSSGAYTYNGVSIDLLFNHIMPCSIGEYSYVGSLIDLLIKWERASIIERFFGRNDLLKKMGFEFNDDGSIFIHDEQVFVNSLNCFLKCWLRLTKI